MNIRKAKMSARRFPLPDNRKFVIGLLSSLLFTGCTSLESRLSIEPYTKNKPMRNALEDVADAYCRNKRAGSGAHPDFIFTTDGCSRWPDNTWIACCIAHDIAYWCGGSELDRNNADRELMRCVNANMHGMGYILYASVRIGGMPWWPTPWRWGYGWDNWPSGYEIPLPSKPVQKLFEDTEVYETIEQHLLKSRH
jgi:hypothetical protein